MFQASMLLYISQAGPSPVRQTSLNLEYEIYCTGCVWQSVRANIILFIVLLYSTSRILQVVHSSITMFELESI